MASECRIFKILRNDPKGWDLHPGAVFHTSQEILDNYKITSLIFGVVILFFTVIVALIISKSFSDPIKKLHEVTRTIAAGKMEVEIDPGIRESGDEISDLANSIQNMSKAILSEDNPKPSTRVSGLEPSRLARWTWMTGLSSNSVQ